MPNSKQTTGKYKKWCLRFLTCLAALLAALAANAAPFDKQGESIIVRNLSEGKVVILSAPLLAQDIIFRIDEKKPSLEEAERPAAKLIGGSYIEVAAETRTGEAVRDFPERARATISIPQLVSLDASRIGLYALREQKGIWELIPSAVFEGDTITFEVNRLSVFAVFEAFTKATEIEASFPSFALEKKKEEMLPVLFDVAAQPKARTASSCRAAFAAFGIAIFAAILYGLHRLMRRWRAARKISPPKI